MNFLLLKNLSLKYCKSLEILTYSKHMKALSNIKVYCCSSMTILPNLSTFLGLLRLELGRCVETFQLNSGVPLTTMRLLDLHGCCCSESLLNLEMFPALKNLLLKGCSRLTTLNSSLPLPALEELDVRGCKSLSGDDLDHLQASCPQCKIKCDKTWRSRMLAVFRK